MNTFWDWWLTLIENLIFIFFPHEWFVSLKEFLLIPRKITELKKNQENLLLSEFSGVGKNLTRKQLLRSNECKIYSQFGADGLILYIFKQIGSHKKTFIEFGIGDGRECNTANLSINFGWEGLLIDGNKKLAEYAKGYYKSKLGDFSSGVKIVNQFITKDTINSIVKNNGFTNEIDLLSIDIDGNDYWIWEEINVVKPRVVIIEYNASFGIDKTRVVIYDPLFDRAKKHPSYWYHGASLPALVKLGKKKGYALVACESSGVNAFFVRKDLLTKSLEEIPVDEAYYSHILRKGTIQEQFNIIKDCEYEYV